MGGKATFCQEICFLKAQSGRYSNTPCFPFKTIDGWVPSSPALSPFSPTVTLQAV